MKKIIFLCAASLIYSLSTFAAPEPKAEEMILKLFHQQYPEIKKPVFYDFGNSYMVFYKKDDKSSGRVYYNSEGEIQKTIKYYTEEDLNPFIREKVNKKYKGKTIFGVTEYLSSDSHFYQIILQDDHSWYNIKSSESGVMSLQEKYKKA